MTYASSTCQCQAHPAPSQVDPSGNISSAARSFIPCPYRAGATRNQRTLTAIHWRSPLPTARHRQSRRGADAVGWGQPTRGPANDRYEREADSVAQQVSGRTSTGQASQRTVQRNTLPQVGPAGGQVESGLARQIEQGKQGGRPLPQMVRRQVEGSLGADFSGVRVHTGEKAEQTNQALGAKAFTHGKHIFLGTHQSPHDVQLMSHELTHTIQQGATQQVATQQGAVAPSMAQRDTVPNMAQQNTAPGGVQRSPAKLSHLQPQIQRENETIKYQGQSKSITKGDHKQFKQGITEMSAQGVKSAGPDEQPKAIMLMGAAGAGKSSIINQLVPDRSNFVHADADQVKEAMPEYQQGLKAGNKNIANTLHNRSKDVTKNVALQAIANRRNLLFDATGNNSAEYLTLISKMRQQGNANQKGYHITLAMVHLSPDEGVKRVAERAKQTGREIPENIVRDMYHWVPQNFPTIANQVDQAYLFDNMVPQGQAPIIVWETSDGTKLEQKHLDPLVDYLTGIENKEIDDTAPEDESYNPEMLPQKKGRYLQDGGTSRWTKETTKKKKGFSVSRKNLGDVDQTLKLYRLHKSKNRGNAQEQATLLKSLQSSVTKSNYQGTDNIKSTLTHLRRRNAMNNLREELKGEFRRNALRLARVASYGEQVKELGKVGMMPEYLNGLLKMDVKRLYEAHVYLSFGQKDLAQKVFDKLNPVEREQTGALKYAGDYVKRSRSRVHFAQQMLTAHHHETIGGEYGRSFAPSSIDDQRMGEITTSYLRNADFLKGVVNAVKKPAYGKKLTTVVENYPDLSSQELEAIRVYTSDTYKQMNATMQDIRLDDPETQKGFKGYTSISQVAVNGLSKLPSYTGSMLYRGDGNFGGLAEAAKVGTSFRTPNFMSTSKDIGRAGNFGVSVAWIVLPAANSSGKDIETISTASPEQEVLFPPGTKMQIVDVIRGPKNSTIPAGEKGPAARERVLKYWKTDSGRPIPTQYLPFMEKFRAVRNTLIIVQEVK